MRRLIRFTPGRAVCACAVLLSVAVADWHRVDDSLTAEDRQYIPRYLVGIAPLRAAPQRQYAEEVGFITRVQQAVLRIAPLNEGIPENSPREPKQVFEARRGLCYDRSRVIEKILRYSGLQTRHVAIYALGNGSAVRALVTRGTASHAITEVLTQRGWIVVDSNDAWVSLDRSDVPVPIAAIRAAAAGGGHPAWRTPPPNDIYLHPFTFVYGLYSRNGRFYAPYDFIPDLEYGELMDNIS